MISFSFDLMDRIALHTIRQEIEEINTGFLFCVAFDFEHSWAFVVTSSLVEVDFFLYSDNNIYVKVSVPLSNLNCIRHTFLVPGIFKSDILGTWSVNFYSTQFTKWKKIFSHYSFCYNFYCSTWECVFGSNPNLHHSCS